MEKKSIREQELEAHLADALHQLEYRDQLLREWLHDARFYVANSEPRIEFETKVRKVLGEEIKE